MNATVLGMNATRTLTQMIYARAGTCNEPRPRVALCLRSLRCCWWATVQRLKHKTNYAIARYQKTSRLLGDKLSKFFSMECRHAPFAADSLFRTKLNHTASHQLQLWLRKSLHKQPQASLCTVPCNAALRKGAERWMPRNMEAKSGETRAARVATASRISCSNGINKAYSL